MSANNGVLNLLFLKLTPGPKGPSEYPDNTGGFDLWNAPTDMATNQGGNMGATLGTVTFNIKGGHEVYETIYGSTVGNSIKTTSAMYKSMLYFNNDRKVQNQREFKEVTFAGVREVPQGGEFEGSVELTFQYTAIDRDAKGFFRNGKAKPTVKTKIDLNKGKITAT